MELSELKPALYNPRKITPEAMASLSKSLESFGDISGIVWNRQTGNLVAGHQRLAALKSKHGDALAMDGEIIRANGETFPVRVVDWDLSKEKLANLAANSPYLGGEFDGTEMARMLDELALHEPESFKALRFDELRPLGYGVPGLTDPDDAPELSEEVITRPGDLWLLGDHRLLCGDSTKVKDVVLLLDGHCPFICVTDPPYGVNYDPQWRVDAAVAGHLAYVARRVGPVLNDDRADWRETWLNFPGDVIYSWHPPGASSLIHAAALQASGFNLRMQIIWSKSNFPISRGDYHIRHEPCWYAVRDGKAAHRTDDRTQTTVWEINLDKNVEGGHSTQKPVECMARPIRNHDASQVYDPFLGSGTTMIAAEQLGRSCFGMEIGPAYVDVCVKRWEAFTGKRAQRLTASVAVEVSGVVCA